MKLFKKDKHKKEWEKYYPKDKLNPQVPDLSIYEYLRNSNLDNMDRVAIRYFDTRMTYRELFDEINVCARAFKSQGIRPGDVVSICMANTPEAIIAFYALNKIGAIANMIHPLSAEEEIKNTLKVSKSVMLITLNQTYANIKNIINDTDVYKIIIVSPKDSMRLFLGLGYYITADHKIKVPKSNELYMKWNDFMLKGEQYKENVVVHTEKDTPAIILHSGGTTGVPKNILLSNGNINVVIEQAKIALPDTNSDDKMLAILPLFHCFGLVEGIHFPLCTGQTCILVPRFDAKRFDKLLRKYKPTIIPGVPTLFEALLSNKHMNNVDLSNVKYIVSGGDTLPPERNRLVNEFLKEHNCKSHIIQGYGMTETSGGVIFGALGSDVLGSCGIPLPGNDVKIVNIETKEEMPTGEIGEMLLAGPSVMLGYLDNEKETNEILEKDENGKIWVHTGDLAYLNKDGVVFYVSRLKRMLIVSGYNVYPSHIEEVLDSHPYVLNSGVIGVPHPYKVQVPKAFIVLKEGIKPTPKVKKEIKDYCTKKLAKYMLPKDYVFKEALPKTMVGKVDYKQLEKEENE